MKTKNLAIIFFIFLLLTLGSGLTVLFTREKEQPVLNEASKIVNTNNQPLPAEPSDQVVKNEPVAEEKQAEVIKDKPISEKAVETKPIVQPEKIIQPEKTVSSSTPTSADQVGQIQAIMLINGVEYKAGVKPDSSVYDLMNILKDQKKIDFKGNNYSDMGFFIQEINGIKNNPAGENWLYYVNSKPAPVGISNYKLKNNDTIEWKYENKSF